MLYHVTHIETLAENVSRLLLKSSSEILSYQAGQYVYVIHKDQTISPLSIASAPHADATLEFHLMHSSRNPKAQSLLHLAQQEKSWQLKGPFGDCTVEQLRPDQPIIFLARGTGFAPIKAVIETIIEWPVYPAMHFYWSVSEPSQLYLLSLIETWVNTLPHFKFTPVFTKDEGSHVPPLKILEDYPDLSAHQVYASGPKPLIYDAFSTFQGHGLKPHHFHSDVLNL